MEKRLGELWEIMIFANGVFSAKNKKCSGGFLRFMSNNYNYEQLFLIMIS